MHLMYRKALLAGVPFLSLPNDSEYGIPDDLQDDAEAVFQNIPYQKKMSVIFIPIMCISLMLMRKTEHQFLRLRHTCLIEQMLLKKQA